MKLPVSLCVAVSSRRGYEFSLRMSPRSNARFASLFQTVRSPTSLSRLSCKSHDAFVHLFVFCSVSISLTNESFATRDSRGRLLMHHLSKVPTRLFRASHTMLSPISSFSLRLHLFDERKLHNPRFPRPPAPASSSKASKLHGP